MNMNPLIFLLNLDSDSDHITSEYVNLTSLYSTDYGCEIHLVNLEDVFLSFVETVPW